MPGNWHSDFRNFVVTLATPIRKNWRGINVGKSKSNEQLILELLEDGEDLTRKEIYDKVGTLKGPSRISDLRMKGHRIEHRKVESLHGSLVNRYYMPEAIEDGTALMYCEECRSLERRQDTDGPGFDCSDCGNRLEIAVSFGDEAAEIPF
jgi:hypothetical protein